MFSEGTVPGIGDEAPQPVAAHVDDQLDQEDPGEEAVDRLQTSRRRREGWRARAGGGAPDRRAGGLLFEPISQRCPEPIRTTIRYPSVARIG